MKAIQKIYHSETEESGSVGRVWDPDMCNLDKLRPEPLPPVRRVLIVVLTVLLAVMLPFTLCLAAVRENITPEYVYSYADRLDFTKLPLPSEDGFRSVSVQMQDSFAAYGMGLTANDVDILFEQFSIPTILASFFQDVTSWLLYNGSRPVLDAEEIATIALSQVDPSIMQILCILGDPVELVSSFLITPLSTLDTNGLFDALEPVRLLLSETVYDFSISICGMLMVLLYFAGSRRLGLVCKPFGISLVSTGIVMGILRLLLLPAIRLLTVTYADYLTTFVRPILPFCGNVALLLILVGVIFMAFGTRAWYERAKKRNYRFFSIGEI